ncbi:MAG TPA: hypothetical protein VJ887_00525 [Actinomycetota bacterium]|nr:hypothetical protein [Actinomycetota bacterium]
MKVRLPAALVLLLTIAACADSPVDPGAGGIDHSTAPDVALVQISNEGGFVPVEWTYTNFPFYSLYGDGTLVVPGAQIEIYPGPALPAVSSRQVSEAGIQAILEQAIAVTRDIPTDLNDLGFMGIADASTTVITVSAGGVDRTIRAYALGELTERPDGMPEREYQARLSLQELVATLTGPTGWLPEGSLGPEGDYDASSARVFVGDYRAVDDLQQDPMVWPLGAGLTGFGDPIPPGEMRCGVVEGVDWDTLRESATAANQLTPWTSAGDRYSILFRPLLPDERGC